jgi:ABC-type uncharacterized transport system ATPase subunit
LHRGANLLILDEPTAVLGPTEVDQLLATMQGLRDAGNTIILITHKLSEVMRVSDHVTVLKDGRVAWSGAVEETNPSRLAEAMVGSDLSTDTPRVNRSAPGKSVLRIKDLTVTDERGAVRLDHVSLETRANEIVGVYGVAGSGQRPLVEAVMGLVQVTGMVVVNDVDISDFDPADRRRSGLSYISPDRRSEGLAMGESILSNVIAGEQRRPAFSRRGVTNLKAWGERLRTVIDRYRIKADSPDTPASALSGGNQQRLVVGRELEAKPQVLIASDPTRGVDIKGVVDIHRFIRAMSDSGGSVLLISHELDEILDLSDRVAVLLSGRLTGTIDAKSVTRARISELMTVGAAS